jgi:hypothetical protein
LKDGTYLREGDMVTFTLVVNPPGHEFPHYVREVTGCRSMSLHSMKMEFPDGDVDDKVEKRRLIHMHGGDVWQRYHDYSSPTHQNVTLKFLKSLISEYIRGYKERSHEYYRRQSTHRNTLPSQ